MAKKVQVQNWHKNLKNVAHILSNNDCSIMKCILLIKRHPLLIIRLKQEKVYHFYAIIILVWWQGKVGQKWVTFWMCIGLLIFFIKWKVRNDCVELNDHMYACHSNLKLSLQWRKEIFVQLVNYTPNFAHFMFNFLHKWLPIHGVQLHTYSVHGHPTSGVRMKAHIFVSYAGPRCL